MGWIGIPKQWEGANYTPPASPFNVECHFAVGVQGLKVVIGQRGVRFGWSETMYHRIDIAINQFIGIGCAVDDLIMVGAANLKPILTL